MRAFYLEEKEMKLEWAMLANHAESANGLGYISGAGIDTVNSPTVPALFRGAIALRLNVHPTEIDRVHTLEIRILSEDGQQIALLTGSLAPIPRDPDLPAGWNYHAMFTLNFNLPLQAIGHYSVEILSDGSHLASLPFRLRSLAPRPS
jgi:hypothetical protein